MLCFYVERSDKKFLVWLSTQIDWYSCQILSCNWLFSKDFNILILIIKTYFKHLFSFSNFDDTIKIHCAILLKKWRKKSRTVVKCAFCTVGLFQEVRHVKLEELLKSTETQSLALTLAYCTVCKKPKFRSSFKNTIQLLIRFFCKKHSSNSIFKNALYF